MVEAKAALGVMSITSFSTQQLLDSIRGKSGGWSRQILFVKDADPLGPNYFVMRDDIAGGTGGIWRLWLTAERIDLREDRAVLVGKEDVDMDIFFLSGR